MPRRKRRPQRKRKLACRAERPEAPDRLAQLKHLDRKEGMLLENRPDEAAGRCDERLACGDDVWLTSDSELDLDEVSDLSEAGGMRNPTDSR